MDRNLNAMQIIIVIVVALRKESVDRNTKKDRQIIKFRVSLSARRAWIEIYRSWPKQSNHRSRSPQGERG